MLTKNVLGRLFGASVKAIKVPKEWQTLGTVFWLFDVCPPAGSKDQAPSAFCYILDSLYLQAPAHQDMRYRTKIPIEVQTGRSAHTVRAIFRNVAVHVIWYKSNGWAHSSTTVSHLPKNRPS